jgi:hypothetical protein
MILYDFILLKNELKGSQTATFCVIFQFLTVFNTIVGAGAVGAGNTSRYSSGSDQMMRLYAALAPQHWKKLLQFVTFLKFIFAKFQL